MWPAARVKTTAPVTFQTFGPKAFFSIAEPIDTLLDQAIHIRMFRPLQGTQKLPFTQVTNATGDMWQRLRDALFTFCNAAGR